MPACARAVSWQSSWLGRTVPSMMFVFFFVTCCRVCVAKADSAFSSPPLFLGTDVKVILLHDIGSVLAQHPRTFRHVMVVTYMHGDSEFVCGVKSSAWRMLCERGDELVGPTQRCLVLLLQSFRPRRPIPCLSKFNGCSSCCFLVFELFIVSDVSLWSPVYLMCLQHPRRERP